MTLVPVLLLSLVASAAQASVAFHVTVMTERVDKPGVKTSLPARDTQDSDVVLGEHYLSVRDGKTLSVLDFATRRRHVIDMAASTYDTYSLFDVAGFRHIELQHRQGMAGALKAGGLQEHATPAVYEEQALSVSLARRRNALVPQVLDGAVLWSLDGHPLLRLGIDGSPVSVADATAFAQYVRYTWGGHPLVLKMLADGKRIPAAFTLHYQEVGGTVAPAFPRQRHDGRGARHIYPGRLPAPPVGGRGVAARKSAGAGGVAAAAGPPGTSRVAGRGGKALCRGKAL